MNYKKLEDLKEIRGKRILLRLDFNVPIEKGVILEDFRIQSSLPTLRYLRDHGAKIIIVSHTESGDKTVVPIIKFLAHQGVYVTFESGPIDDALIEKTKNLAYGGIMLLENLRRFPGEKANDPEFSKKLAMLGDAYVNDAFAVSHRAHASVVGVTAHLPSFAGYLFDREVTELAKSFQPTHPFLFILGGAKIETKLPLIRKFMSLADTLFVGGVLANDCLREMNYEVGMSAVSEKREDLKDVVQNEKVLLPTDVVVKNTSRVFEVSAREIGKSDAVLDIGKGAIELIRKSAKDAKFIIWNGPLGYYEGGFTAGTEEVAKIIAGSGAYTIVGGGDTIAAISKVNLHEKFGFLSTGGGAMLDYLANETLPAIEALEQSLIKNP